MLKKEFLEEHEDGVVFYRVYSDEGKGVLEVETGVTYDEVAITDDDPHTYVEGDLIPEEESVNGDDIPASEALSIIMGDEI